MKQHEHIGLTGKVNQVKTSLSSIDRHRQINIESGAFVELTGGPDNPIMIVNYFFADREANARSFVDFLVVKTLKNLKDLVAEMRFESYAVVSKDDVAILIFWIRNLSGKLGALYHPGTQRDQRVPQN